MGTHYRPYELEQAFLLPPSLRDWLPEDHLLYFISDTIDQLDLSAFHPRCGGDGRRHQPCHPTMLAKVLIYAYATGVFSSRKIAAKLTDDVALRVLAAGNRPDFRTINRFRQGKVHERPVSTRRTPLDERRCTGQYVEHGEQAQRSHGGLLTHFASPRGEKRGLRLSE